MIRGVAPATHLRSLRVCAVDEDERGHGIGQCEAAELTRVEFSPVVAADDARYHHQYAEVFGLADEAVERICPRGVFAALRQVAIFDLVIPTSYSASSRERRSRLLRQGGAEERGWRGLSFWWPVVVTPLSAVTSVFADEAPADAGAVTA